MCEWTASSSHQRVRGRAGWLLVSQQSLPCGEPPPNAGSILGQRLRRWPNMDPALGRLMGCQRSSQQQQAAWTTRPPTAMATTPGAQRAGQTTGAAPDQTIDICQKTKQWLNLSRLVCYLLGSSPTFQEKSCQAPQHWLVWSVLAIYVPHGTKEKCRLYKQYIILFQNRSIRNTPNWQTQTGSVSQVHPIWQMAGFGRGISIICCEGSYCRYLICNQKSSTA